MACWSCADTAARSSMERLERASMPRATRCKSIAACCWLKCTICIRRIDVSNVAD
eukprot:CAMPEP_0195652922 /NCGR_PEP_ID=MMETSP0815-20121206/33093_1 /TAXON_ID=97485 /ORGANISM="Prymnesium parvum, Strain Texoma1" /LENGTH=54 /DNA_ID=CAMNT_0040796995 /DNA_START=11 /DNA_END=172 /DNA_ORIENTATION=+